MVDKLTLSTIPYEQLGRFWGDVKPLLERGIGLAGEYDLNTVVKGIQERDFLLWGLFDEELRVKSACISSVTVYPLKKVCTVVAGSGKDLSRWVRAFDEISEWAKSQGCDTCRVVGRKGWARALKNMKITAVNYERDLS